MKNLIGQWLIVTDYYGLKIDKVTRKKGVLTLKGETHSKYVISEDEWNAMKLSDGTYDQDKVFALIQERSKEYVDDIKATSPYIELVDGIRVTKSKHKHKHKYIVLGDEVYRETTTYTGIRKFQRVKASIVDGVVTEVA